MDFSQRLAISYYKTIATINESHKVYLVQHQDTGKIYIKKCLDIYNYDVYDNLFHNPVIGVPEIIEMCEYDSQLIVIEEFISGNTLQDIIESSSLSIKLIIHYMTSLCTILAKLHSFNPPIIHRDIKPSNIIVTPFNNIVLLDFNAAKYYSAHSSEDTVLLGTKGYAAPEQYGFGSSTPLTDIYSAGIVLKEMVDSIDDTAAAHMFDEIITRCTQINPSDRFASAEELLLSIKALDTGSSVSHGDNTDTAKTHDWKRFLPPGFRTLNFSHMLAAAPVYIIIFLICVSSEVENTTPGELLVCRIFLFLILMSIILISWNYLNLQKSLPLCRSSNKVVRYTGIILADIITVFSLIMAFVFIETLFFSH